MGSWAFCTGHLLNTTNNRVESFNGHLKTVIEHYSSLNDFVDGFFTVLYALRNERDNRVAKSVTKQIVHKHPVNSAESKYLHLLTTYSAKSVWKQLASLKYVGNIIQVNENEFSVQNSPYVITKSSCMCGFFMAMGLPCKHIFAVRYYKNVPLYDPSLCSERWKKSYCRQHHRVFKESSVTSSSSSKTTSTHNISNKRDFKGFFISSYVKNSNIFFAHDPMISFF